MKNNFILLPIFMLSMVCSDVLGARLYQTSAINALYGAAYWKPCTAKGTATSRAVDKESLGGGDEDSPCIGNTRDKCDNVHGSPYISDVRTYTWEDEFGKVLMIAREANANGAQFCPTSITARNRRGSWAWTEYSKANGDCVWLCKKGWTGDKCSKSVADSSVQCDSTKLLPENYKDTVLTDSFQKGNIEDYIVMWGANYTDRCSSGWGQEHDLIFAISKWLPSGHGAWARPYMVRARHDNTYGLVSWIEIYPAASSQYNYDTITPSKLYCKIGYQPNASGTDCEAINETLCNVSWCDGWDSKKYDNKNMTLNAENGCLQWRCAKTNDALTRAGETGCSQCIKSMKDGINPLNGTCVQCGTGKYFDPETQGFCRESRKITKAELLYGPGKTKDSPIGEQCWTKTDNDKYKACVLGLPEPTPTEQ
ncbi:MAG: hypothetical protein IKN73_02400 [Alphaproteobacteria bacterium]|nr:hypothetical protein [Alphaproteobacteria bacterium]